MKHFLCMLLVTIAGLALAQGGQGGAAGTANDGQTQNFNLILTPGQTAEVKVVAKENDVILVNVNSNAFDPSAALYAPDGAKLVENDDVVEGNQSPQFIYRMKTAGEYKVVVSGFKGAAGGPFTLNLKRFSAPPISGTTYRSDFNDKNEPEWRAIPVKKEVPTVIAVFGSRNYIPTGYDSKGNRLDNQGDRFSHDSGGRFTYISPIDEEIYVHIPHVGFKNYTLDILPVEFKTIDKNAPIEGTLPRSQTIAYRFRANAGDLVRTQIGPGRDGFQVIFRAVELDNKQVGPQIGDLLGLSKTPNVSTHFIRQSGTYEAVVAHSDFRDKPFQLKVIDYAQSWQFENSTESLPIGENLYYKWEMPLGVLLDLSANSEVFDLNMTLMSPEGHPIAELDDEGESRNPKYQMLVTRPGTYFLRIGSVGNGGGGSFNLNRALTLPSRYESGKQIEVSSSKPELRLISCKNGQFFYLTVQRDKEVGISLYRPDGRQIGFSAIDEPNGRRLILITPDVDGEYLMVLKANVESANVTISNASIGG